MKFITNEEWKVLLEQPNEILINEILSRVYNAAVEEAIKKLPEVVTRMVKNTTATQIMTKEFFAANKGFDKHTEIVAGVLEDIESQYPNKDYKDVMAEAVPLIREKIAASKNIPDLSLDCPDNPNLDGNGVI